ncbi:hypothetical protein J7M23_08305 [Candidatus Sumerlaeota bacterium]|nr:hypothetical protein [Candidatus Sumerlaeota bacterium]
MPLETEKKRAVKQVVSINCPQCGGTTTAISSHRIFQCQHCGTRLLLTGRRSISQLSIVPQITRQQAISISFSLCENKLVSPEMTEQAVLQDVSLVYVPLLEVRERAVVIQKTRKVRRSTFGVLQKRSWIPADNFTYDTNINFLERYVGIPLVFKQDWGLDRLALTRIDWQSGGLLGTAKVIPYDPVELKKKGTVLNPPSLDIDSLEKKYQQLTEKFYLTTQEMKKIDSAFRVIYYPIWLCRISLGNAVYTISIEAIKGKVLNALLPQRIRYRPLYAIIPSAVLGYLFSGVGRAMLTGEVDSLARSMMSILTSLLRIRLDVMIYFVLFSLSGLLAVLSYFWIQFRYQGLVQFAKDSVPRIIKVNKPPKTFLEKISEKLAETSESLLEIQLRRRAWFR